MAKLRLFLFGKFQVQQNGQTVTGLGGRKTQELLCYLAVHKNRPHVREKLADLLWPEKRQSKSRRYLRQALWQIQSTFDESHENGAGLITVELDWLQINPQADLWTDVGHIEEIARNIQDIPETSLNANAVHQVETAVRLYRGDLLENCYQDWSTLERERLRNIYLGLLDRLMECCQDRERYSAGIDYGMRLLRTDVARERTYRKLMRLHYLNNDRTSAMRQYWRCCQVLEQELGVQPARETVELFEHIRDTRPLVRASLAAANRNNAGTPDQGTADLPPGLDQLTSRILQTQEQLQQDVVALHKALSDKDH